MTLPVPASARAVGEGGGDLRGMVSVVVVEPHATRFPTKIEPAARPGEVPESADSVRLRDPRELQGCKRTRRIPAIVLAWDSEANVSRLEVGAPHDRRFDTLGDPAAKALLELGQRGERRVVVELDVRDDGDLGLEREGRPIGLIPFDDEPSLARACVPAELRYLGSDQVSRLLAELLEAEGDHGRGRRLPVCTGDDDRAPERDELGQKVGTALSLDPPREGGRDDRLESGWTGDRIRSDRDGDPLGADTGQVGRLDPVPTRHLGTPRPRQDPVGAEPGAADADQPEAPSVKR